MTRSASPLEGKTTDWRAGCGRSACPVRREGGRVTAPPYPYHVFCARTKEDVDGGAKPGHDERRANASLNFPILAPMGLYPGADP